MTIYNILSSIHHNPHYLNRYIRFIEKCQHQKIESIFEKHHIVPKGKDMFPVYSSFIEHPWNRCDLTPRQHYIAHWILYKAFPTSYSQFYAFYAFSMNQRNDSNIKINSKVYEELKIKHIESISGPNNYFAQNKFYGEDNHFYGKNHTEEFKKKQSARRKNKTWGEIFGEDKADYLKKKRSKFMLDNNPFKGKKHTEESRQKMSEKARNKSEETRQKMSINALNSPKTTCPHCGKTVDCRNYSRWHGDKCKYK